MNTDGTEDGTDGAEKLADRIGENRGSSLAKEVKGVKRVGATKRGDGGRLARRLRDGNGGSL